MPGSEDMVEISSSDLAAYKRAMSLLDKLTGDKEGGISIQRKLKEIDPTLNLPGIDVGDAVVKPIKEELSATQEKLNALIAEREAERQKAVDEKLESGLRASVGRAQAKYKLSDEATGNLLKFMQEKGVADAEIAAPAFMETLPKPPAPIKPNSYTPMNANLFGTGDDRGTDEDIAALHRDPLKWFDAEVVKIMNEAERAA
jgi:hypothetical protein